MKRHILFLCFFAYHNFLIAQVGINTENPHPSSILDVTSTNKGVLFPRVTLNSSTDTQTIENPARGLLIYNTGEGNLKTEGYLFWNGTEWVRLNSSTSKPPEITALECGNARLEPSTFEKDKEYTGSLIVPYNNGNGGYYNSADAIPSTGVTGLTATLQSDYLAYGRGELVFKVEGVPSNSSPELATFDITFLNQSCSASVGSNSITQGQQTYWHGSMPANVYGTNVLASNYIDDLPVIEDVFRMDAQFSAASTGTSGVTLNPRMYNLTNKPIKIWASSMSSQEGYGYSNVVIPANGYIEFDNGVYLNQGSTSSATASSGRLANNGQETITIDLFYNSHWYRLYYTIFVDNKNGTDRAAMTRELYLSTQRLY